MAEGRERESDMILAPNEFMFVQDNTKGHVDCYVGPTKQSLSGTPARAAPDSAPASDAAAPAGSVPS